MMKKIIMFLVLLLSILTLSCSASLNTQPTDTVPGDQEMPLGEPSAALAASSTRADQQQNKGMPDLSVSTATLQPTAAVIQLESCPSTAGYSWSEVFSTETSYITTILPSTDGNFLISAVVDDNDGVWIAKIDPDGKLIWQKKFIPAYGVLSAAPNGNYLLTFQTWAVEIDTDGDIIKRLQTPGMLPNLDGSYTVMDEGQIMRYIDSHQPQWDVSFVDSSMLGYLTSDGGAIYAYAGSYVDDSVYYMPIYTDIKIIKVDGNGQVWQRVYGRLVGDESLDYVETTTDGGAILAGTHAYEDLGSDYDIWLMKLNTTGSISWQTTLKLAPNSEPITNLYPLPSGVLLVSEDYENGDMRLVKLTKNGALAWQKRVNSIRGRIGIYAVADTKDGGLIIAGLTEEMTNVSFMARFNSKGELVWEKLIGFSGIKDSSDTFVETILPLENGSLLVGGGTNVLGLGLSESYSAWLINMEDKGEILGLLTINPGKFSIGNSISNRPKTIPDEIVEPGLITIKEINQPVEQTIYQTQPACMPELVTFPTPQTLPSLTPSMTPTLSFVRDLFLTDPAMQGDDVLNLQQRLLSLGYEEVGVPDGFFGKMTQNAVRLFQKNNDLEVDGYVGPLTWQKLFSDSVVRKE